MTGVRPRLLLILTENHTLVDPGDLVGLVRLATDAEEAGFDAVMASEHVVLGLDFVSGLDAVRSR